MSLFILRSSSSLCSLSFFWSCWVKSLYSLIFCCTKLSCKCRIFSKCSLLHKACYSSFSFLKFWKSIIACSDRHSSYFVGEIGDYWLLWLVKFLSNSVSLKLLSFRCFGMFCTRSVDWPRFELICNWLARLFDSSFLPLLLLGDWLLLDCK